MRVNKFYLGLFLFLFVFASLKAQNTGYAKQRKDSILNNITNIDRQLKKISDRNNTTGFSAPIKIDTAFANRLNEANLQPQRNKKGLVVLQNDWSPFDERTNFKDTVIIDPVFLPVIFDGKILPSDLNFLSKGKNDDIAPDFHLITADSTFSPQLSRVGQIEESRRVYYMNNPLKIRLNLFDFKDAPTPTENFVEKKNIFKELLTTDDPIGINMPEVEKIKIKPVYWINTGEHSLQINQNSFSNNWATGGNNNFSVINYHKVTLKYKKDKISFDNTFEWRLNLQRTSADEFHNISITDDNLRMYNVFGVSAFKKWSYTANFEVTTPLFHGYPVNSEERIRSLFSPLNMKVGVGMGYKLENISKVDKYRRLDLSMEIAPASLNYTIVGDTAVNETRYGVDEGKKSKLDFGSTVKMNFSYGFNRYSKFTSRLMYFTNYEKVIFESENKYTLALNRYLSTSIYAYLRYDDSVPIDNKAKGWGYLQFNEIVGFGLSYTW